MCLIMLEYTVLPGGYEALHGSGGAGGSHQLPEGLLPEDRHVRHGLGAVGAGVSLLRDRW